MLALPVFDASSLTRSVCCRRCARGCAESQLHDRHPAPFQHWAGQTDAANERPGLSGSSKLRSCSLASHRQHYSCRCPHNTVAPHNDERRHRRNQHPQATRLIHAQPRRARNDDDCSEPTTASPRTPGLTHPQRPTDGGAGGCIRLPSSTCTTHQQHRLCRN